jgi:hypothetical protein
MTIACTGAMLNAALYLSGVFVAESAMSTTFGSWMRSRRNGSVMSSTW